MVEKFRGHFLHSRAKSSRHGRFLSVKHRGIPHGGVVGGHVGVMGVSHKFMLLVTCRGGVGNRCLSKGPADFVAVLVSEFAEEKFEA